MKATTGGLMNRDEAKAKVKAAAQYVEAKAEEGLVNVETKFPLGTAIVCAVLGLIIGLYLRGLFR